MRSARLPPAILRVPMLRIRRAQKFSGPPTRIRVLVSEAGTSWDVQAGTVVDVPKALADVLIRKQHARLARPDERLTFAPIE